MIDDDQSWDLVVRIPGYVHRPPALKPRNSATGGALHRLPFTRSFVQFFRTHPPTPTRAWKKPWPMWPGNPEHTATSSVETAVPDSP